MPSTPADDEADDIGVAATLPVSLAGSELPLPALPQPTPALDAERTRVLSALFGDSAEKVKVGRYVVRGTLGQGGMGSVLEAFDPGLSRRVALKVLRHGLGEQHDARLRREALALAKLSHPNVVQVYEVGDAEGQLFVAMELIEGETLREWLRREPRPSWRECLEVYLQVGAGLVAAHEQGLIHRDFKPANAIIDRKGRPRLLDFGLARRVEGLGGDDFMASKAGAMDDPLTHTGAVLGTPAYMPPEQMHGGEADRRSDQFSFCVSLYEAVYGERPFAGDTIVALMKATFRGEVRPAPKGVDVPPKLRSVLVRGMAAESEHRWSSMEVLLEELRSVLEPGRKPRAGLMAMVGLAGIMTVTGTVFLLPGNEHASPVDSPSFDGVEAAREPRMNPVQITREGTMGSYSITDLAAVDATSGLEERSGSSESSGGRAVVREGKFEPEENETDSSTAVNAGAPEFRRQKTDRSLRKELERKLRRCGKDGTIEVTADWIDPTGKLLQAKVDVRGAAAEQPGVRSCAEEHLRKFKLLPRKEVSFFDPLMVTL